jgi:predicted ABC-type ATPase
VTDSSLLMVIVGGPNGSGKSTITESMRQEPQFKNLDLLNPDVIGKDLRSHGVHKLLDGVQPLTKFTDWVAARAVTRRVKESIVARRSFLVETVLSTNKYLAHVKHARGLGFYVSLIFVTLPDPALNWARVEDRRQRGGHGVPKGKVRARWERSHAMLPEFAALADDVRVFDNSAVDGIPRLVVTKDRRLDPFRLHLSGILPQVERALGL